MTLNSSYTQVDLDTLERLMIEKERADPMYPYVLKRDLLAAAPTLIAELRASRTRIERQIARELTRDGEFMAALAAKDAEIERLTKLVEHLADDLDDMSGWPT